MEILLAALVAAAVSGAVVLLAPRARGAAVAGNGRTVTGERRRSRARPRARTAHPASGADSELSARDAELDVRERELAERERVLAVAQAAAEEARERRLRSLEQVASLSASQARAELLAELEDETRHERARRIRQVEEETRHEADRRARGILAASMQRIAATHSAETTVTTVALQSDELKGRIIGRDGRNIRSLESVTGIDVVVDDTPGSVLLSGFDGVRREIARITLEKLLEDGRIHPARIEEAHAQATAEIERHTVELGERAALETGVGILHPELVRLLGRLRFRTSYGQNVLSHSIECARLATLVAEELGADAKVAARAALLHDVGKAVTHEIEGPHALVGGELARRHDESDAVAHAIEAHHNEVDPETVEAVIVQIADALSGARPGARGKSLEDYVARLQDLEGVAARHPGIDKVYAMHAGRELRVIVKPEEIDDDGATILSRDIAREVERELKYPGQVKVTVIRESRSTDYAR